MAVARYKMIFVDLSNNIPMIDFFSDLKLFLFNLT